ncbi:hypothetical protein NSK_001752 [Nannochloropsis salina CCMP1776]|uniref:Uncharacterized protein n=1 Tax=Nannochloropsis salina CCMP1776 TaxID=1027361 RepID=A0A4D9D7P0_9STRA|nr:hypothetical protein NSK_001752 [Nannochloropsis salina CCMP1776]|eukprot:TFJ87420.1 hypothetical protein NSK_001752 [Nannochloropsis salina CCMP1776]
MSTSRLFRRAESQLAASLVFTLLFFLLLSADCFLLRSSPLGPCTASTSSRYGKMTLPCEGSGSPGPLTDSCTVGDVIVLVLPYSLSHSSTSLALAVVDGPNEACLLCLRDPETLEWYRDHRSDATVLRGVTTASLLQVIENASYSQRNIPSLGGGVGYGADAEDCWLIEEKDLPGGLVKPLDVKATAPWMFVG